LIKDLRIRLFSPASRSREKFFPATVLAGKWQGKSPAAASPLLSRHFASLAQPIRLDLGASMAKY